MGRSITGRQRAPRVSRHAHELVVRPRRSRHTVAVQWHDSVGELHYQELTPAQSWPYLHPRHTA